MPEALKIVLFSMAAAIVYGILHDMVTAQLCVEYFTIAHPLIIPTESPFLLALFWGVFATWWVGLFLGTALALAARLGPAPKISLAGLRRSIILLMLLSAIAALIAGITGAVLITNGQAALPGEWPYLIQPERHATFFAVGLAHLTSYAAGGIGGLVLIVLTIVKRLRR